jgi:hypothetical protein
MMPSNKPWPEELQVRLVALWNAGLSSGMICRQPGFIGLTRNAIIGQLWRLRKRHPERFLNSRLPKPRRVRPRRRRGGRLTGHIHMTTFSRKPPTPPKPSPAPDPKAPGIPLLELDPNGCRFIVSSENGRVPTHLYCGVDASPWAGLGYDPPADCYCGYHQRLLRHG